jgi:hypothetical protein
MELDLPLITSSSARKESWFRKFYRCIFCCNRRIVSFIQTTHNWRNWKIWVKIREKLGKKVEFDKVYILVRDLYTQKPNISEINNCKLFPELNSNVRDDLEFYIPQLW